MFQPGRSDGELHKTTYVGIVVGDCRNYTTRLGGHLGSAQQPPQEDTVKPVGRHFRLPGHEVHRDLQMITLEIGHSELFLLRARETFYINKIRTEKMSQSLKLNTGSTT